MLSPVDSSKESTKTLSHLVRITGSWKAEGPQQGHPLDIRSQELPINKPQWTSHLQRTGKGGCSGSSLLAADRTENPNQVVALHACFSSQLPMIYTWALRGINSLQEQCSSEPGGAWRGIRTTLGHFCQPLSLSKEPRGNFQKTRNPSWASHLVWNYGQSIVDICLPQQLIILAGEKPFRLRPHFTEGAICRFWAAVGSEWLLLCG